MKKSLLLVLLTFGMLSFGFSQDLTYYVENQTSISWDVDLTDDGVPTTVNLSLASGQIAQGTINDFDFDIRQRFSN